MISKYIKQFMDDNDLSVNEDFTIKSINGSKVLINGNECFRIVDIDNGRLIVVSDIKENSPAMLLEAALVQLLRENYFVEKKPFGPAVGERYYFVDQLGSVVDRIFVGSAEDFLLCKYIGVYKTKEAAIKNISRCLKLWEEVKRK
jgi:hypothetical protein